MSWAPREWIIIILCLRFSVLQGILFTIKIMCSHQPTFMQEDLKQPFTLKQSLSVLEGSKEKLNDVIKPAILFNCLCLFQYRQLSKPSQETSAFMTNSLMSGSGKLPDCPLHWEHSTSFFFLNTLWPTSRTVVSSVAKLREAVIPFAHFSYTYILQIVLFKVSFA